MTEVRRALAPRCGLGGEYANVVFSALTSSFFNTQVPKKKTETMHMSIYTTPVRLLHRSRRESPTHDVDVGSVWFHAGARLPR